MTGLLGPFIEHRLALLPFAYDVEDLLLRDVALQAPGRRSANGSCGLFRTTDGWVALNLARADDRELVPALTGRTGDPWAHLPPVLAVRKTVDLVQEMTELGLPGAALGEAEPSAFVGRVTGRTDVRVLDLSALWAGPLCAALLAIAGADVRRIDNLARPDPTPQTAPRLNERLNDEKHRVSLDLSTGAGLAALRREAMQADVIVTSARSGALARMGLDDTFLKAHPGLLWIAITAYGWEVDRVGFGDDCAVAGGLVRHEGDEPLFMGDALADPLTGLEAALAALDALGEGRTGRIDMAMSRTAASYARAIA